ERDAAQAQPRADGAHLRAGARPARVRADGHGECRPLARTRHLALVDRADHAAGRDDAARLHARHLHRRHARAAGVPGAHAREPRADAGAGVFAAGAAGADRGRALAAGRLRDRAAARDAGVEAADAVPRAAGVGRRGDIAAVACAARCALRLRRLHEARRRQLPPPRAAVSALPPNAMRPPADLRGRHDLGEIVGYAWRIYLRNFGTLFALALLTVPVQMLAGAIQAQVDSGDRMNVTYALLLPNALVSLIAGAAVV